VSIADGAGCWQRIGNAPAAVGPLEACRPFHQAAHRVLTAETLAGYELLAERAAVR